MSRSLSFVLLAVLVVGLVGCDHATKRMAETGLRGQPPTTLISNLLELRYTENRDVGFSLLRSVKESVRKPLIMVAASSGLLFLGFVWLRRRGARWPEHVAFALILAGGLGNLTDRLIRGYVVDFVYLHHWPVFNAADVWLVAGAILMLLASRMRPPEPAPAPAPQ